MLCPRLGVGTDGCLVELLSLRVAGIVEVGGLEVHPVISLGFFYRLQDKKMYIRTLESGSNVCVCVCSYFVPLPASLVELVEKIVSSTLLVQLFCFVLQQNKASLYIQSNCVADVHYGILAYSGALPEWPAWPLAVG